MIEILLQKNYFDRYSIVEFSGTALDSLAEFLVSDALLAVNISPTEENFFIKWLNDTDPKMTGLLAIRWKW